MNRSASAKRRSRRLAEFFYERFFYNDLISSQDDPQLAAANIMAMLAFPGLLTLYWVPKYFVFLALASESVRRVEAFGDRFLWIAFEMGVLGLVTTLQWERLFPDRRDYSILGPQPISIGTLFHAQVTALARFIGLFFLIVNGFAAFFLPLAVIPWKAGSWEGLTFVAGHWLSLFAAGAAIASFVAGLQGVLVAVLPAAWFSRFSAAAQSVLAACFVAFIVFVPVLRSQVLSAGSDVTEIAQSSSWARALPPVWFAALGEWAAGRNAEAFSSLAWTALTALAGTMTVFAAAYLMTYRRFVARSLEGPAALRGERSRIRRTVHRVLRSLLFRDPVEYAAFSFTLRTLVRSAPHRIYVGGFIAVGCATAFAQSWTAVEHGTLEQVARAQPYILLFLALAGLRIAYSIPADLPANWAFRFHLLKDPHPYLSGVRAAVWASAPIPIGIASTLAITALFSLETAAYRLPVWAVASWLSTEAVLWQFSKVPFTCRYLAGRAHVIILWTFCAVGMLVYGEALASVEVWAFERPWRGGLLLVLLPLLFRYVRARPNAIVFEESDPLAQPIRLNS